MEAGGLMLQGVYEEDGRTYYLFPVGENHYYASKFPNVRAHRGCFHKDSFQLVATEEWPAEPQVVEHTLDPEKIYQATLIWRREGYKQVELKEYYIKPREVHGYFYHDQELTIFGGCYPLHWFTGFKELEKDEVESIFEDFDIDFTDSDHIFVENAHETNNFEQLSLFTLMEE